MFTKNDTFSILIDCYNILTTEFDKPDLFGWIIDSNPGIW